MVLGAILLRGGSSDTSQDLSMEQVTAANGKEGQPCYVVLERTVYEIKQGNKWRDGEHTTSEGEAYCGMDATEVIKKSPHGKTVMSLLTKVGMLR